MDFEDSLIGVGAELDNSRTATGELRLIAAVLEAAIHDVKRGDAEAIAWFASDDDAPGADGWTYLGVCEHLGMDPMWLRTEVSAFVAAHPYKKQLKRRAALEQAAAA